MRFFYLIFAAACLLCSCAKDAVSAPEKSMTLAVEVADDATRTFVEGDKIYWSQSGDKLGIVYFADQNSGSRKFTGTNDEYTVSENSARFTADYTATEGASSYTFGAFYPYSYKYTTSTIPLTVPQSQTPTESSYDPTADILVSKEPVTVEGTPSTVNFTFSRLVAIVNMTIKGIPAGEKIESVTFSSPAKPAGTMSVVLHEAGTLDNAKFYNNYEDITLNLNDRVATGEESLWFTAAPTDFSGSSFTVTVVTNKNDYTKTVDMTGVEKPLKFERANIARFSVSDLKVAEKSYVFELNFPLEGATSGAALSTVKVNDYISLYSAEGSWRVSSTDGWGGIFMGTGKSLTFSTNDPESYVLTKIELVSRDGYTLSTDKGSGATVTWEGESSSVSFQAKSAARIVSAVVYCKAK